MSLLFLSFQRPPSFLLVSFYSPPLLATLLLWIKVKVKRRRYIYQAEWIYVESKSKQAGGIDKEGELQSLRGLAIIIWPPRAGPLPQTSVYLFVTSGWPSSIDICISFGHLWLALRRHLYICLQLNSTLASENTGSRQSLTFKTSPTAGPWKWYLLGICLEFSLNLWTKFL